MGEGGLLASVHSNVNLQCTYYILSLIGCDEVLHAHTLASCQFSCSQLGITCILSMHVFPCISLTLEHILLVLPSASSMAHGNILERTGRGPTRAMPVCDVLTLTKSPHYYPFS